MKNFLLFISFFSLFTNFLHSQVAINISGNSPDASAGLDVSFNNKGILIPRLTQAQRNAITSPATSLLIYQTDNTPGYYYFDGTTWRLLGGYTAGAGISIVGNVITNTAPDQTVTITGGSGISIGGSYPNFTITNTGITSNCSNSNYLPKTSSATSLICSQIYDNGTNVGIGTSSPLYKLDLNQGTFGFGNGNVRTETRDNAGLQGSAGAQSGFFETANPINYPSGATNWWHLIDCRHSNNTNNYALQISGSFFDQLLYYRKTNNNPSQPWKVILATDNLGSPGQILVSQGSGNLPTWQTPNTIPMYGNNMNSVKLTTYATNNNTSSWTTLLTLNITPVHNTIYIFSSLGTRLEDNSGMAQFGQALVQARILVNGVEVARNAAVVTDFDEDSYGGSYVVTSGSVAFSGIPVSVSIGTPTTITLEWKPAINWANSPWRLGIDPNNATIGDHAVLTVFD